MATAPSDVLGSVPSIPLGTIGLALLIFFGVVIGLGILVGGILWWMNEKKYNKKIPLYKKVGGKVQKVGTYKAKVFPLSRAGDCLWFVKGKGIRKFIPPATLQSAPNEFTHFERADGEWINIEFPDIDADMKKMGVKYIHQDMRTQRIATQEVLENRFQDKKWWDKYGHIVMSIVFVLIITIQMVVVFWMWGKIVDDTGGIARNLNNLFDKIVEYESKQNAGESLVPALALIVFPFKKLFWRKRN